jgi:hypothetical protein
MDPFTIYATFDRAAALQDGLTEGVNNRWNWIDNPLTLTVRSGARRRQQPVPHVAPFHGTHDDFDHTVGERFGTPHIDLTQRALRPTGIKGFRAGFPLVTHGGVLDLDIQHNGIQTAEAFGAPERHAGRGHAPHQRRHGRARRVRQQRIELQNRQVDCSRLRERALG